MKLFIDTSVFVDVLRSKQVESSKSLFKSLRGVIKVFAGFRGVNTSRGGLARRI